MKKLFLFLAIFTVSVTVQAQESIKWMTFNEAISLQQKNIKNPKKLKPIFMDVYTEWCGPCKMLDRNTFSDPSVIKYINENFYAVKFNAEGNETINYKGKEFKNPRFNPQNTSGRNSMNEFTEYLEIQGYPSMAIIDKKGNYTPSMAIVGYRGPQELLADLKNKNL